MRSTRAITCPRENRLTRIDAHLMLFLRGKQIWQTTPTARTDGPLAEAACLLSLRAWP